MDANSGKGLSGENRKCSSLAGNGVARDGFIVSIGGSKTDRLAGESVTLSPSRKKVVLIASRNQRPVREPTLLRPTISRHSHSRRWSVLRCPVAKRRNDGSSARASVVADQRDEQRRRHRTAARTRNRAWGNVCRDRRTDASGTRGRRAICRLQYGPVLSH